MATAIDLVMMYKKEKRMMERTSRKSMPVLEPGDPRQPRQRRGKGKVAWHSPSRSATSALALRAAMAIFGIVQGECGSRQKETKGK